MSDYELLSLILMCGLFIVAIMAYISSNKEITAPT